MAKDLRTFDGLTNKLAEELGWRRKELTIIQNKIPTTKNAMQSVFLRSAVPLLYAHWEGFVKVTLSCYLEYVSSKHLTNDKLQYSFLALSLQNKIGDLEVNSIINKTKVVETLFNEYTNRSNIPKKGIINTKSNLKYDVFQEMLLILNLEESSFSAKKDLINDLVDMRNHIAHGEYLQVDLKLYNEFHNDIIALFEVIKTQIENNALLEKYKR
ncbi:MAE_28990/MAE_18760 family HEPN-like nuclease [Sulfurimonas microaerophilic]|uniref:MAE_28990/MAE_18760 family HEPN-like nuclease n=1 Tax=Sulfurimonas microaerophilic TaxID=3058392 RepID=UPI002715358A|nr:MAE_28990/MAE_18760 family HEPN-like nuclease [Sulfurimonas sp. hsl 1-7]